ncbi:MAG: hypothetical protein LUG16_08920 [Candidatus Gastranaerophilales bacterium]|nr:hypothetical protein [Candidatus Gastranaerophilales bacterium]
MNSELQETYMEKWENDTAYIERFENLDKFQQAKEIILQKAHELKDVYNLGEVEAFKELVKTTVKSLDFLQPSDKAKLTANILDSASSSPVMLRAGIDNILDIAKTMDDNAYRKKLASEINKELEGTKNIKKGSRTVGKYDYKTNKLFC